MKLKENCLYEAIDSFLTPDGHIKVGELLWGDDIRVRQHPQLFRESPRHSRPEVEDATAAPGRKRGART